MELAESHLILLVLGKALAIMGVPFWLYWFGPSSWTKLLWARAVIGQHPSTRPGL
jgi:hypothetical protein